ncbi:MAG: MFS transporter [Campylobacteraceae bacterium]|nr:MFS transporter [Campylobacteraceae bacterium]
MSSNSVSKMATITVLSLSLTTVMAAAAIAPALGMIARHFSGHDTILISQIVSVHSIFIIFSTFFFSYLAKFFNTKDLAMLGLTLYVIGGVGAAFVDNIYVILALRGVLGLGVGLIQPLSTALIAYLYDDKEKVKLLGYSSSVSSFMGLIAAPLSAYLAAISWNYSFYIYLLGLVIAIFVLLFLPRVMLRKKSNVEISKVEITKQIHPFIIGVFLSMLVFYSFPTNFSIVMAERMEPKYIGVLMGYQHLCVIIVGIVFSTILQKLGKKAKFLFALFFALGFLSQYLATNFVHVFLGLTFVGLAQGFMMPFMMSSVGLKVSKPNMAVAMGMMSTSLYLGQFLNPYIAKIIQTIFGLEPGVSAFGMSFAFSLILFIWMFYVDKFR